jgi:hypothetical protein
VEMVDITELLFPLLRPPCWVELKHIDVFATAI